MPDPITVVVEEKVAKFKRIYGSIVGKATLELEGESFRKDFMEIAEAARKSESQWWMQHVTKILEGFNRGDLDIQDALLEERAKRLHSSNQETQE